MRAVFSSSFIFLLLSLFSLLFFCYFLKLDYSLTR
nr:MAG TPA: hypothetical protein [Caudoviricetes sp.]